MNGRSILFSATITAIVGACLSILLTEMRPHIYPNSAARHSALVPGITGVVLGFLAGAGQESVRQLKAERDREDQLRNYLNTYLYLRDIENKPDK